MRKSLFVNINSEQIDWLRRIFYEDQIILIKTINKSGEVKDTLYHLSEVDNISFINESNVFFGCVARDKAKKPIESQLLWTDIDYKQLDETLLSKREASLIKLNNILYRPSAIIESGHGLHCYWFLTESITDMDTVKELNQKLAILVNGDQCWDSDRVLRLPYSKNYKDDNAIDVIPYRISGRYYDINKIVKMTKHIKLPKLSNKILDIINKGYPDDCIDRSKVDYYVIVNMVKVGMSDDDIVHTFETKPIGNKFREKGNDGYRYLHRTIAKCREDIDE